MDQKKSNSSTVKRPPLVRILPADKPSRRQWVPPVLLVMLGFGLALLGDVVNLATTASGWFREPPLPKVSEQYLMIEATEGDLRRAITGIASQVPGLQVTVPKWLEADLVRIGETKTQFCETNQFTREDAFPKPEDPGRLALIQDCLTNATETLLIGTYAIRSFEAGPLNNLSVEMAVLTNSEGTVNALDGFVGGSLSQEDRCFFSDGLGRCVATWTENETVNKLPEIGAGEMVLLPIFVSAQFRWTYIHSPPDGDPTFEGFALTPFRFPIRVKVGDRILIASSRPMNETPSLREGFYVSRG